MHIMKYPIINGELPKLEPVIEYHLVTIRGTLAATFEDKELAIKRWKAAPYLKLIEVTRRFQEITPVDRKMAEAA